MPTAGTHLIFESQGSFANRLLEQFCYWSISSFFSVAVQINRRVRMRSSSNPIGQGTPPNPHSVEGNKEKERTVKSGRNSVYGAPEHSCLAMEVGVTGEAAIRLSYSGICQMVKSFKHTYVQYID